MQVTAEEVEGLEGRLWGINRMAQIVRIEAILQPIAHSTTTTYMVQVSDAEVQELEGCLQGIDRMAQIVRAAT